MRVSLLFQLCLLCAVAQSATLEKLSLEEMAQKSTLIVRGSITACTGEAKGSLIYTKCTVSVSERWKGSSGPQLEFYVPGGTARGLVQIFTGTPKFTAGQENVLFLWSGRSGLNQVIGLSQGVFDIYTDGKGGVAAKRSATAERIVDAAGQPVRDNGIEMNLSALRQRVSQVLNGGRP